MTQTSDGGYLIAGTSYSPISGNKTEANLGIEQTWIIKTDSFGNLEWDKTLYTAGHDEAGFAIQAKEGCFVMANYTNGGIGGYKTQPSQGSFDYWIIKFYDSTFVKLPTVNILSSDTSFCEKQCINFYDLSTNNPTTWQWFFQGSDSLMSNMQNPIGICYNNYGSFDVTLIACNAAGCDTLFLPCFINEYQIPSPFITQSNDTLFSTPAVAYQWWSVDSGLIVGATNSYYIPTQGGSYFVIVTDTIGCNGSSNTIVIMGVAPLSPFGEGLGVRLVPNPNNGSFTISLNKVVTKDFSLSIFDFLGQTIFKSQVAIVNQGEALEISMGYAIPGLYVVEMINDGKVYRTRFIVQ